MKRWLRQQLAQASQVEGRTGESEDGLHLPESPVHELPQSAHVLHPAEGFLHHLAPPLRDLVAVVAYGAAVDGVVALLLGHVRGDPERPGLAHEALGVVASVGAHRHGAPASPGALPAKHQGGCLRFGRAGRPGELAVDDEAVAVLDEDVPAVREFGFFALDPGQAGIRIGGRGVRVV